MENARMNKNAAIADTGETIVKSNNSSFVGRFKERRRRQRQQHAHTRKKFYLSSQIIIAQSFSSVLRVTSKYLLLLLLMLASSNPSCGRALAMDSPATSAPSLGSTLIATVDETMSDTYPSTSSGTFVTEEPTDSGDRADQIVLDDYIRVGNITLAPSDEHIVTGDNLDALSVDNSSSTRNPTAIYAAPTMVPALKRKTFLPTQDPIAPPGIGSSVPTFFDTFDRQDTGTTGPGGEVPVIPGAPTANSAISMTPTYVNTIRPSVDEPVRPNAQFPTLGDTLEDQQDTPGPTGGTPIATFAPSNINYLGNNLTDETATPASFPPRTQIDAPTQSTPSPTRCPTLRPTRFPSPGSTLNPTSYPTEPPKVPTGRPTRPNTAFPTSGPTLGSSPRPTTFPTIRSASGPAFQQSARPSGTPTSSPAVMPTGAPSDTPTNIPIPLPTTLIPSIYPSAKPTVEPSMSVVPTTETPKPTISARPSDMPSNSPTEIPSWSPSDVPSSYPSFIPTGVPTSRPSSSPSLSLQNEGERVVMTMRYSDILEGLSIITWEQITATHIRQSIQGATLDPPMDDLRVWTNIVQQTSINTMETVPAVAAAALPPAVRRRSLQIARRAQGGSVPLRVAFDTAVSYRSRGMDHNIQELISNAFGTAENRQAYIDSLKRTNDGAFQVLNEIVSVSVSGVVIPEEGDKLDDDRDMTVFIIAGACAGGGALLLLILFLLWRSYARGKRTQTVGKPETAVTGSDTNGVTTEIVMEQDRDEVSTLGDPMGGMYSPNVGMMGRDERTASVGDDYDYKYLKHHGFGDVDGPSRDRAISEKDRRPRMMSDDNSLLRDASKNTFQSKLGFSQMGESIFSDDASFEEQYTEPEQQDPFEIRVPAGKLGMVIDTPNGGFPIVHAIKDTSILADRVRVADRLVSVDGQDCTTMTAVQVSKLISLKSEQESRVLVFVRCRVRPTLVK